MNLKFEYLTRFLQNTNINLFTKTCIYFSFYKYKLIFSNEIAKLDFFKNLVKLINYIFLTNINKIILLIRLKILI